jgi:hypothetical protein
MRWNPFLNAIGAAAYIASLVSLMQFISSFRHDTPDTVFDGMGVISLVVFSAAVMAFLFFYRPLVLLIEDKREAALAFFLKTLGAFGAITAVVIITLTVLYR